MRFMKMSFHRDSSIIYGIYERTSIRTWRPLAPHVYLIPVEYSIEMVDNRGLFHWVLPQRIVTPSEERAPRALCNKKPSVPARTTFDSVQWSNADVACVKANPELARDTVRNALPETEVYGLMLASRYQGTLLVEDPEVWKNEQIDRLAAGGWRPK